MRLSLRSSCPSGLLIALLICGCLVTGCQTTVGNYFANRGRDLGECFLLQVGTGFGVDADVKAAGIVHANVGLGLFVPEFSLGWVYGTARPVKGVQPFGHVRGEGDMGLLFVHSSGRSLSGQDVVHRCHAILPCLLSWENHKPLWSSLDEATRREGESQRPPEVESGMREWREAERFKMRKARVHAFDIEAGAFVLLVGARAGFSPGEFLDFLLGWVGIDIAGDDRPLAAGDATAAGSGGTPLPSEK